MKEDKLKYYIAFSYLDIRPIFKSRLFEFFDYDIIRAYNAKENDIQAMCEYYDMNFTQTFINKRDKTNPDECFKKAQNSLGINFLTYEDEKYPPLLKEIPDFPLFLYYMGNLENMDFSHNLAIVGSRKATQEAKIALAKIISGLKNTDITIISGLAYGIDATAHENALKNNLKTIAVTGTGLDIQYPPQNKKLYKEILEKDNVIFSEFPIGTFGEARNFPQRNRIVVGMSKGTLVAEARIKSGAMISANLTLDYNRELMCMPGNITNPNTSGIYHLIKNGASLVSETSDLLNYLNWEIVKEEKKEIKHENYIWDKILNIISCEAKTFDEIALEAHEETSTIMVGLTELELKGLIKQSGNKYYKIG